MNDNAEPQDLGLTHEEIFNKIEKTFELIIVHLKPDLVPHLCNSFTGELYKMPDGYMEYDKAHYWRNAA